MLFSEKQLIARKPSLIVIFELFVHHPIFVTGVCFRIFSVSSENVAYHPVMTMQQFYNLFLTILAPNAWYIKLLSVVVNFAMFITVFAYQYGLEGKQFQLMSIFLFSTTLFTGIFLHQNEKYLRNEFQMRQKEKYQNQKFINVLQLMKDSILIINQAKSDNIIYANEAFYKFQKYLQNTLQGLGSKETFQEIQPQSSTKNTNEFNSLQELFQNLTFRPEFSVENLRTCNFQQLIDLERNIIEQQVSNYYFKLEPISISIQVNFSHLTEDGQILIIFKEISAIKKLQNAKNKEKFTNIFINSTAHNIFTPINGLLGIAELIEREVTHVSQASQYVKIMKNCINHLYYTTQNIIEHSRLRLKQQTNETKEINVFDLITKVPQIFGEDTQKKKIAFQQKMNQNFKISIDESKVSLVFYNILSNAFKYTEQGQLTVEAKIIEINQIEEIQSQLDQNLKDQLSDFKSDFEILSQQYLYISVIDTGSGISEVSPDKLFNLFSSFKISEDNINHQGLGLGLSISSLICKQLGGKLFVEYSKFNQGSKFSFIIPVSVIFQSHDQLFFDEMIMKKAYYQKLLGTTILRYKNMNSNKDCLHIVMMSVLLQKILILKTIIVICYKKQISKIQTLKMIV
eukprot:403360234